MLIISWKHYESMAALAGSTSQLFGMSRSWGSTEAAPLGCCQLSRGCGHVGAVFAASRDFQRHFHRNLTEMAAKGKLITGH